MTSPDPLTSPYSSIEQIRKDNPHWFFSTDTMRFWRTRVADGLWPVPGGALFITSDRPDRERPRTYRLRYAYRDADGYSGITTVSEHDTLAQARSEAQRVQAYRNTNAK